jgi:hypothetical protein
VFWSTLTVAQIRLRGNFVVRAAESTGHSSLCAGSADPPAQDNGARAAFRKLAIPSEVSFGGKNYIYSCGRMQASVL